MAARRSRAPATGLEEHAARVAHLAVLTAHQLRVPEADVERIHLAALLHDVGKTAIPDSLLSKPGEDPTKEIKKLTGGGPDYAFECVGSGALAELAYKAIRRGGKAVIVGVARATDAASIRTMGMVFEEKTLQGSYFGSCVPRIDFPRMLQLYMAGKLKLDELITRRYKIDEAPQAFADLESGKNARGVIVF